MKKYFYLIGVFTTTIFSSSCTKDFVCECTTTYAGSTNADITETTIKDAKKTHAKAACATLEYTYSYANSIIVITQECELK
jgi:hypothetical protein